MEIQEAKKLKNEMARRIWEEIDSFERITGLVVSEIHLGRIHQLGEDDFLADLEIDVRWP